MKTLISVGLIVIIGLAVYGNSLRGEFLLDDIHLVKNNAYIKSPSNIPRIFTKYVGSGMKYSFYRPLQIFTYLTDYSLYRLDVKGYHLSSTITHILVALCVFWLGYLLCNNWEASLLAGILFAVHPVHTEAVSYISGRADPLAALFMLLSFILYIKYFVSRTIGLFIMMLLCYILALLSRENVLIFPALLLLYHYAFKRKLEVKAFLLVLAVTLLYILIRLTALRPLLAGISPETTLIQRIPGFFAATANYSGLLLLPLHLHMEHGNKVYPFIHPKTITGIVILCSILIYAFRKRNSDGLVFFCTLWFFLTLLPHANLFPINAYMAEHWLYLPSIGFFLILANVFGRFYQEKGSRAFALALAVCLVAFYSSSTIRHNNYWKGPAVFWGKTLKYAPKSPRVHNGLGNLYYHAGENEKAIASYKKAIEVDPEHVESYTNLGIIYNSTGKDEEAIALYKKAVELNPDHAQAYNSLGIAYRSIGKDEEAITSYNKAIEINPAYEEAYSNLGNAYYNIGEEGKAIEFSDKAIKINPDHAEVCNNLGALYYKMGKYNEAMALFKRAVKIDPSYAKAYTNIGNLYRDIGNDEGAAAIYAKTMEMDPGNAEAYNNLGAAYYRMGKTEEAIRLYEKAIGIDPRHVEAYSNLGAAYYKMGKNEEAIRLYEKAIEIDPRHVEAYNNLGAAYHRLGKTEEVIATFKKAIKINPDNADIYNNLGIAYNSIGNNEGSIASYAKAIEIDPDNAMAHNNLAVAYYHNKQYGLAIEHCDKAVRLGYKPRAELLKLLQPHRK
ncbi:tetratricopeptide repeat protein [Omnitrophica bacterium]|nr:tetratricopeptide repeat protein [Candidatus Omnitrophota bacterium]